jgi:hypothetical protein
VVTVLLLLGHGIDIVVEVVHSPQMMLPWCRDMPSMLEISSANGPHLDMQDLQPEPKKGQPPLPPPTNISCVVLDGEVVDPANWKTLESLPTKQELIQRLAVALNTPATRLARSIKMVPTKLAIAVKALSELDEDMALTVEEAAKRKAEKAD